MLLQEKFKHVLTDGWRRRFSDSYTNARFYKVDVDELPTVAQQLEIRAMPTFVIFKDGKSVKTVVGANPAAVEDAIKEVSA